MIANNAPAIVHTTFDPTFDGPFQPATSLRYRSLLPDWLTVREAATYLGVSTDFVYDACATGGLIHVRLCGRRGIRIAPSELNAWMQRHATSCAQGVQ